MFIPIVLITMASLFLSCGKNGEITKNDDPGILPEVDAPIIQDEPEAPPNIEIINNLECPDCPTAVCCNSDSSTCCESDTPNNCDEDPTTTDPTDDPPTKPSDDPADNPFDFTYIPLILFEPTFLPFFDSVEPDEKDTLYNDSDFPEACLDITDTDTHWWLAYLLTGGILSEIDFDEIDYSSEESATGYTSYKAMALPGEEAVKLEMEYELGKGKLNDTGLVFTPDNYTLAYHYLTYDDPVLGNISIDGSLSCTGETHYYLETEGWHRRHNCTSTDDHFIVFIKGVKYVLDFDILRQFNGIEFFLAGHSFPDSQLTINNALYDIKKTLPMSISLCLRFSKTDSGSTNSRE